MIPELECGMMRTNVLQRWEERMIAYIKGRIADVYENRVVVDVHDIGYQIFISAREAQALPPAGEAVRLHTYLNVKEDAMQLYGFQSRDDLEVFRLLLGVNGIGPKAALGILSALSADDLRFAVLSDDAKTIARAPGIGPKTAKKMILELKDKLSLEEAFEKRLDHGCTGPARWGGDDGCQKRGRRGSDSPWLLRFRCAAGRKWGKGGPGGRCGTDTEGSFKADVIFREDVKHGKANHYHGHYGRR